jgi:hypothetical protein
MSYSTHPSYPAQRYDGDKGELSAVFRPATTWSRHLSRTRRDRSCARSARPICASAARTQGKPVIEGDPAPPTR